MGKLIYGWMDYVPELLRALNKSLRRALEYRGLRLEVSVMDPRSKELVFLIQLSPDRAIRLAVKISERRWWMSPSMGERYFKRFIKHISKYIAREGSLSIDNEVLILTGHFAKHSKPERRYRFMPVGGVGRKGHRTRIHTRSPSGATYSTTIFSYHKPPRALVKLVLGLLRRIMGARYERLMASCRAKGMEPYGRLADFCEVLRELRDLIGLGLNVNG